MGLTAKDSGGGDFKPAPEGTHMAICNMIVDLGLQRNVWMDEVKLQRQVYIRWELPHERIQYKNAEGNDMEGPVVVGKFYTNSLSDKANLRKDLQAWRGRAFTAEELAGFDLTTIVGKGCQITIMHKTTEERTTARVVAVAGWPKGIPHPTETEVPTVVFDLDYPENLGDLPEWLQKKIAERVEDRLASDPPIPASADDYGAEVPF